ncbi:MAG TPA: hypothetical protein VK804_18545 [Bradyrhizobium sp.]|jgi:hypothetical protein|uniref:hypothetical protein n=1 Tax=Bradyrhizobium sp. TaxID=376 RepID=UPI002CADCCE5|nr:hypothetical protein [Bradyrhizobium sp.]HTB02470.1 hypothetical protein [Bradyrhizobium sp.]
MGMQEGYAELDILRDFIDFINQQVGVYCDCLSGFEGNKVRIERQISRVTRPTSRRIEEGQPVIVWTSLEDPSRPDIIHNKITRSDEFIRANSEAGFNERQICWSIIVFIFAHWDEKVRPEIANMRGVQPNDVRINALGDLRILRKSIVHNEGVISAEDYRKIKKMADLFSPNATINLDHDQMHKLFIFLKQAIAELILHHTGDLPGAPKASDLTDIAIQNAGTARLRNPYGFWTTSWSPKK